VKSQFREWEKVVAIYSSDKEPITRICKKLNSKKKRKKIIPNNPIYKWETDISQMKYKWPMSI
jgi:hypothetical protein